MATQENETADYSDPNDYKTLERIGELYPDTLPYKTLSWMFKCRKQNGQNHIFLLVGNQKTAHMPSLMRHMDERRAQGLRCN